MKYLSAKQNKEINIQLINTDNDKEFQARAIADNGDVMGTAYFSVNRKERKLWLRKIETKPKYQNLGIGKALLDTLEYFTIQNRLCVIEGKFYPDNEYARPFYLKNGYDIYKEDYETYVGKYISHESLAEEDKKRIIDYEVLPAEELTKDL